MNKRTCFFIGHREASEEIYPKLKSEIEKHIKLGVTEFIVGHYGGFDRLSAKAVIELKKTYPNIILTMLSPYHPAEYHMEKPDNFDGIYYPFEEEKIPHRFAIVKANKYMIDHADYLIAYVCHPASNAMNLLKYAEKKEIKITRV